MELSDIKGDLHVHSCYSDGTAGIEEMAAAARKLNLSYMAVTDHSKSLSISGGLNEERLKMQGLEIDALNSEHDDFMILKGIEVDILKDGSLDLSADVLEQLDIVVASVHSHFQLDKEKQTERIINAIKDEHVDIIGHLTGRLLNRRPGYELDCEEIIKQASMNKVALEINAHPDRLDIDEYLAREAKSMGVKIAINSDAHHPGDLKLLKYGVMNARRGWLQREDVLNTWDCGEVLSFLHRSK